MRNLYLSNRTLCVQIIGFFKYRSKLKHPLYHVFQIRAPLFLDINKYPAAPDNKTATSL